MTKKNDDVLLPMIPGSEFSGEVLELGRNCRHDLKSGDKIVSLLGKKIWMEAPELVSEEDGYF